jgi:hypothetical protein
MNLADYQKFMAVSASMDGVFTLADFRVLYGSDSAATRFRKLEDLVEAGELLRVKKGLYARPDADLRRISQRIAPDSYLSLGTVLAAEGLIGSIPARRVWAVRVGRPRSYDCTLGRIEHLSIAPGLCVGWTLREGLKWADPEKAYLDAWYFSYKGRNLSFDLLEDVDRDRLDAEKLAAYVSVYDRRFQVYYRNQMEPI